MGAIQSNLASEKGRIEISTLNIHNFCAVPTVVSTFGTQTGTIWQLPTKEKISLAFFNAHRMTEILPSFDPKTGQPKEFRRMLDWPQADYSAYQNVATTMQHMAGATLKVPFSILNSLYKTVKERFGFEGDTWFDKVFKDEGQITAYFKQVANDNYRPDELEQKIKDALQSHYVSSRTSEKSMGIHHFDPQVQAFLLDVDNAKKFKVEGLGWGECLKAMYNEDGCTTINAFSIVKQGDRMEIALSGSKFTTIFDFRENLFFTLRGKETPSLPAILGDKVSELDAGVKGLREDLEDIKEGSKTFQAKQDQLVKLQQELQYLTDKLNEVEKSYQSTHSAEVGRVFTQRTATAKVPGSDAVRLLDSNDYGSLRTQEMLALMREAKDGDVVHVDGAIAEAEGSRSLVISSNPTSAQVNLLVQLGMSRTRSLEEESEERERVDKPSKKSKP